MTINLSKKQNDHSNPKSLSVKLSICFLIFFAFSSKTFAVRDSEMVDLLSSYLDYGHYHGLTDSGESCKVEVTKGTRPHGKWLNAKYHLKIRWKDNFAEYYFLTNRVVGGKGDCVSIDIESPLTLETQSSGHNFPCFSRENRSSSKGLGIYYSPVTAQKVVRVFDYSYIEMSNCTISP